MDKIDISIPYSKEIRLPIELFGNLPKNKSEQLQEELMQIYFANNPRVLKEISDASEGDSELFQMKKEQYFNQAMDDEYAFDVDILAKRNDEIAKRLVEEINKYNQQVETINK